jgi:hypothetical protein
MRSTWASYLLYCTEDAVPAWYEYTYRSSWWIWCRILRSTLAHTDWRYLGTVVEQTKKQPIWFNLIWLSILIDDSFNRHFHHRASRVDDGPSQNAKAHFSTTRWVELMKTKNPTHCWIILILWCCTGLVAYLHVEKKLAPFASDRIIVPDRTFTLAPDGDSLIGI